MRVCNKYELDFVIVNRGIIKRCAVGVLKAKAKQNGLLTSMLKDENFNDHDDDI